MHQSVVQRLIVHEVAQMPHGAPKDNDPDLPSRQGVLSGHGRGRPWGTVMSEPPNCHAKSPAAIPSDDDCGRATKLPGAQAPPASRAQAGRGGTRRTRQQVAKAFIAHYKRMCRNSVHLERLAVCWRSLNRCHPEIIPV